MILLKILAAIYVLSAIVSYKFVWTEFDDEKTYPFNREFIARVVSMIPLFNTYICISELITWIREQIKMYKIMIPLNEMARRHGYKNFKAMAADTNKKPNDGPDKNQNNEQPG